MKIIRIAGVPEHYNLPFYNLFKDQPFISKGIQIEWSTYKTGTGAMLKDLELNNLDMAVLLTEGALTNSFSKNDVQIVSTYVKSPLTWGVHTHAKHAFDISKGITSETRFAISRLKSGSHLMAYLYAKKFNVELSDEQFVIVDNMEGAAEAMAKNEADLFLWEKFTTKPLVDKGIFIRVDICPTPWEPFVIVARKEFLNHHSNQVDQVLRWISNQTQKLIQQPDSTVDDLVRTFQLERNDIKEWFRTLRWDVHAIHDNTYFNNVLDTLAELKIIEPNYAHKN